MKNLMYSNNFLNKHWQTISGQKIRRQYFNICLYQLTALVFGNFIMFAVLNNLHDMTKAVSDILEFSIAFIKLEAPILLLSICNRFFFGEIVCIVNEKGIHYEYGCIEWDNITEIIYEIRFPSKRKIEHCYVHVVGTKKEINLMYAPYHLLRRAKRYNPNIHVHFSRESIYRIVFFILVPIIVSVIILLSHN